MKNPRILLACEESQEVCKAFRARGIEAFSCDLLPCTGDHPEWHIICEDEEWIYGEADSGEYDYVIAFPPCTHLSVSGARWFPQKRKDGTQLKSIDFFLFFTSLANVKGWAIENPVGIMSTVYRTPNQIIQPYNFGDDASKATCLWLKGLPRLKDTQYIAPRIVNGKKRWANQTDSGQNKLGPSETRASVRAKTYPGIARAMADQWGNFILSRP